ncbi:Zinc finger, AN1-type [Phytophthora cactorum]|nr:Zinc finger, AN1-type [Phytophthora cactorum]
MVTKTSTSSSAPAADTPAGVSSASATSTATASSTVVATTPASTPSDCLKAPPSGAGSPSSVDASPDASASAPRYGRVPPAYSRAEEEKPAAKIMKVKLNKKKEDSKPVQKNRRRCWECKVKVGLTAVKCRSQLRLQFKTAGKRKLEEENPVVVPAKVARIN